MAPNRSISTLWEKTLSTTLPIIDLLYNHRNFHIITVYKDFLPYSGDILLKT
jgi:hypothetical protein